MTWLWPMLFSGPVLRFSGFLKWLSKGSWQLILHKLNGCPDSPSLGTVYIERKRVISLALGWGDRWLIVNTNLSDFMGSFLRGKYDIKIGDSVVRFTFVGSSRYTWHFLGLNIEQHFWAQRDGFLFNFIEKYHVQRNAQIISIWLDEFFYKATSPQNEYIWIGKRKKEFSSSSPKKWYWLIVWNTLWGHCWSSWERSFQPFLKFLW